MAESTPSPALPSTADPTPYAPVSWLAVAALSVAVLFGLILLAFGITAFISKKLLLMEPMLALPIIAIVLSFAARRAIRTSEGTRTGENLANFAWWLAVILGLCYAAYLLAISFAIRKDAESEVGKWIGLLSKGDDDGLRRAFAYTLPPGARQGTLLEQNAMQLRHGEELARFASMDISKLTRRNKGETSFVPNSVNWTYQGGAVECLVVGTVKCPEGAFPTIVGLKGEEGVSGSEGGRQWTIQRPRGSFIDPSRATRTPYGWMVSLLEEAGSSYGREYIAHTLTGPASQYYAYRAFVTQPCEPRSLGNTIRDRSPPGGWAAIARSPLLQLAFAAPSQLAGDADYASYRAKQFFSLPGGKPADAATRERFLTIMDHAGVRPPGERLKSSEGGPASADDSITITDSAVEVRVLVEIPLLSAGKIETARGYLLVECRDPAVLAQLKQLKTSADPDQGAATEPEGVRNTQARWRVVRVESDLVPVSDGSRRPEPGQMPGAPDS